MTERALSISHGDLRRRTPPCLAFGLGRPLVLCSGVHRREASLFGVSEDIGQGTGMDSVSSVRVKLSNSNCTSSVALRRGVCIRSRAEELEHAHQVRLLYATNRSSARVSDIRRRDRRCRSCPKHSRYTRAPL